MKKPLVIAIDGPSASGKGTLAKKISAHFNLPYLNTGALYRLVAFRLIRACSQTTQGNNGLFASSRGSFDASDFEKFSSDSRISEENYSSSPAQNSLRSEAKTLGTGSNKKIDQNNFEKFIPELVANISESDLENEILFGEDVGSVASIVAKNSKLRAALFDFQRDFVKSEKGAVLDGRDTTTIIAPNADFKFFITADVEIRAKRRFEQLKKGGQAPLVPDPKEILQQLKKRDENDLNRSDAPLKIATDAHVIDNGNLSIEEGFQKILKIINS